MTTPGGAAPRSASPGWYASPGEEGLARYWDGQVWTGRRQPLPPPADAVPVLPSARLRTDDPGAGYPGLRGFAGRTVSGATGHRPRYRIRRLQPIGTEPGTGAAKPGRRRGLVTFGLVMLALGATFLIISVAVLKPTIWDNARVGAGEATTTGVVVDQNRHNLRQDNRWRCAPEATFVVDGKEYVARATYESTECPSRGFEVEVIYRIDDPTDSHVVSAPTTQAIFLLFPLMGLVVLGIGLAILADGLGLRTKLRALRARRHDAALDGPSEHPRGG